MNDFHTELGNLGIIALAALLSSIVGIERELARRPAGLRTHILVGVASALLIVLGRSILAEFQENTSAAIHADPVRILQAVVVGISFLGAGTIVHDQNGRVEGLTTAASILLTAGIGAAVALDRPILATMLAVGVATVLFLLGRVETWLGFDSPPTSAATMNSARHRRGGPGGD